MPPRLASDLARLLEPLLTGADLAGAQRLARTVADAAALAKRLQQRKLLTAFQVERLLADRGSELLVGDYVLVDELGEGAMGQVYKARRHLTGAIVALKRLRFDSAPAAQAVKRFQREMLIAGQLIHPNVVRMLDSASGAEDSFYVMELVDGVDLATLVDEHGPLPVATACAYALQVATGLQYIHERGLVHRDIKPHNLMATAVPGKNEPETIKILDLGLAILRPPENDGKTVLRLTRLGTPMGTPDFMAPEQTLSAHEVDIRADVYSLGCTLFYLLTGQAPFASGPISQRLFAHRQLPAPDARELRPEILAALSGVIKKMMAKKPEERYQTPGEVVEELRVSAVGAARGLTSGMVKSRLSARTGLRRKPAALPIASRNAASTMLAPINDTDVRAGGDTQTTGWRRLRWGVLAGSVVCGLLILILMYRAPSAAETDAPEKAREYSDAGPKELVLPSTSAAPDRRDGDPVKEEGKKPASSDLAPMKKEPDRLPAALKLHLSTGRVTLKHGDRFGIKVRVDRVNFAGPVTLRVVGAPPGISAVDQVVAEGVAEADFSGTIGYLAPYGAHRFKIVAQYEDVSDALAQEVFLPPPAGSFFSHGLFRARTLPDCLDATVVISLSDGRWLVTGHEDGAIKLWNTETGREAHRLLGHAKAVTSLVEQPGQPFLFSAGLDAKILRWDLSGSEPVLRPSVLSAHKGGVTSLAFSADGRRLCSGSQDKTVKIWENGRVLRSLHGHAGPVLCVAISKDGKKAFSSGRVGVLKAWDIEEGVEKKTIRTGEDVLALTLAGDERVFVAGAPGLKVWDVAKGKLTPAWDLRGEIHSLCLSSAGKRLLAVGGAAPFPGIHICDLEKGAAMAALPDGSARAVCASFNGKRLFTTGRGHARMWELEPPPPFNLLGHLSEVSALVTDGTVLFSGDRQGTIKAWDLASGKEIHSWAAHAQTVTSLALSPDGERLFSASLDQTIKTWDVSAGREVALFAGHEGPVHKILLSPDGKRLFSASGDRTIKVWDVDARKEVAALRGHEDAVHALALAPDGKTLFSAGADRVVRAWDWPSATASRKFIGHGSGVRALVVADDWLFSAGDDASIRAWDLVRGRDDRIWHGHRLGISDLALSPDRKSLVSAGFDGAIKIWDATTSVETLTLGGHAGKILALAPSADGKRLFTAGADHTIRVWDMENSGPFVPFAGVTNLAALKPGEEVVVRGKVRATDQANVISVRGYLRANVFIMRLEADKTYRLTLERPGKLRDGFNPFLGMQDKEGARLIFDDDRRDAQVRNVTFVPKLTDDYRIVAGALTGEGAFTLTIKREP